MSSEVQDSNQARPKIIVRKHTIKMILGAQISTKTTVSYSKQAEVSEKDFKHATLLLELCAS